MPTRPLCRKVSSYLHKSCYVPVVRTAVRTGPDKRGGGGETIGPPRKSRALKRSVADVTIKSAKLHIYKPLLL